MHVNKIQGQNFGATIRNNKILRDVVENYCLHRELFAKKPVNTKFVLDEFAKVKTNTSNSYDVIELTKMRDAGFSYPEADFDKIVEGYASIGGQTKPFSAGLREAISLDDCNKNCKRLVKNIIDTFSEKQNSDDKDILNSIINAITK